MALVTQPPILIDPTGFARQDNSTGPHFLFIRGSNAYAVLENQDTGAMEVQKSTDEGQTWVNQDSANAPASFSELLTYDDVGNDKIGLCYTIFVGPTPKYVYQEFDTSTDAYGAVSAQFSLGGSPWQKELLWKKLDGTPVVVIYQGGAGHSATLLSAGVWSAPALIYTASAAGALGTGFRDSAGTYHAWLTPTPGTNLYHVGIDNTLTPSAETLIYSAATLIPTVGRLLSDGANIRGLALVEDAPAVFKALAFVGTPLAAPVFTTYVVDTSSAGEAYTWPDSELDKDGNWVVFWALTSSTQDQEMMATFGGSTFGVPVVFYDAVANPPPNVDTIGNFIHTVDAHQFSDGTWLMLTAMETLDLGGACTGFALSTAGGGIPLTLDCPAVSTAQVGVFYDQFLGVSGGTPPYFFEVIP